MAENLGASKGARNFPEVEAGRRRAYPLTAAHAWILTGAVLNVSAWVMSALGVLSATGYVAVIALLLVGLATWYRTQNRHKPAQVAVPWYRFRKPLPFCFLLMAGLILASGILHPPNNYDATQYRIPRVLNWLAEQRWHWIHTFNPALNSHVTGTEWLLAPWLALTRTDRWIFLINWSGFLLLPGLVFSCFSRLGVRKIVAWHWMWLLPSGYNFVLQAGGSANDIIGAVYALTAMHFVLRARETRRVADAWFGLLGAALLSGSKLSNLPLLLPIAVALLPSAPVLLRRPLATAAVCILAAGASVLPIAILNYNHCGDWTGAANERYEVKGHYTSPEPVTYSFLIKDPVVGITGNTLIVAADHLLPPVFPMAGWWNARFLNFFPPDYRQKILNNFEADVFRMRELAGEEKAGLGFGVSWILIGSVVAAYLAGRKLRALPARIRTTGRHRGYSRWHAWAVALSPYISLLVFMTRSGITATSRILAPYYAFLVAPLLFGAGQERVVRNRWWRRAVIAAYVIAFGVLIVAPERPLWPAITILNKLQQKHPESGVLRRASTVYEVYANRRDSFAPLREFLPPNNRVVGMLSIRNEASASLWRPFGTKRVRQLLFSDSREKLDQWQVQYVVARDLGPDFRAWLQHVHGEIIGTKNIQMLAGSEPITWHVVRLRP